MEKMDGVTLRPYRREDSPVLAKLFFETVHTVNQKDYTPQQLWAWAGEIPPWEEWDRSFAGRLALVAVRQKEILGFGDLDAARGYLDRLFVRWDCQGRGIGSLLCRALEEGCPGELVYTYASVTAQPFFLSRGYRLCRRQLVERRGVLLENARMEKKLAR